MFRLHPDLYSVLSSDHRSVNEADRCSACTLTNEPSRGTRRTRRSLARHSIQMFRLIRLLVAPADAPQKCPFFSSATLPVLFFFLFATTTAATAISSCGVPRRLVKATPRIRDHRIFHTSYIVSQSQSIYSPHRYQTKLKRFRISLN